MTEAERILALSPRQPLNGQRVLRISGFAGRGEMPNSTQIQAVKVGSLNVGTMSGKGREVVDLMERRKLEVLCLQETRWRGNKARELGRGFKLFYSGADGRGRNGVGIILSPNHKENVISVWRKNDRIMLIKLIIGNTIINIMSVYAPPQ
nr:craniofacial development protein 2-like [Penaeus vannamei]